MSSKIKKQISWATSILRANKHCCILVIALSLPLFAALFSPSFRLVMLDHVGLTLVFWGVFGEVVLEWKKFKTRRGKFIAFFQLLLIAGLLWEFQDAIRVEKELIQAKLALLPRAERLLHSQFRRSLTGRPAGMLIALYIPNDHEAFSFAAALTEEAKFSGWQTGSPLRIPSELMSEQWKKWYVPLPFMQLPMQVLFTGTAGPLTIVTPNDSLSTKAFNTPGSSLAGALTKSGFGYDSHSDMCLITNLVSAHVREAMGGTPNALLSNIVIQTTIRNDSNWVVIVVGEKE